MVDKEPLPPLDTEEPDPREAVGLRCAKCGWTRGSMRYKESSDWLHIECERCGYGWDELPLDASDKVRASYS